MYGSWELQYPSAGERYTEEGRGNKVNSLNSVDNPGYITAQWDN